MDARPVAEKAVEMLKTNKYDFIVINFANCDMVGHTGSFEAAKTAAEVVDECCGKVVNEALKQDYIVLITADHGNAEEMWDDKINMPKTAHTTNPVEFIYVANDINYIKLAEGGKLSDIAPTVLELLGIDIPTDMTAKSLIL